MNLDDDDDDDETDVNMEENNEVKAEIIKT